VKLHVIHVNAIANKMEDLESYYDEENEKKEEYFLDKLKKGEKLTQAEKEYLLGTHELRKKYYKYYKQQLRKEKIKDFEIIKKKIQAKKKNKTKKIEVKKLDMNLSWFQRKRIRILEWRYRFYRKMHRLFEKFVPEKLIFIFYKIRKKTKRFLISVRECISKIFNSIINFFVLIFSGLKKGLKWISEKTTNIFKKENSGKKEEKSKSPGEKKDNNAKENSEKTK